jgi:hypothetical protein
MFEQVPAALNHNSQIIDILLFNTISGWFLETGCHPLIPLKSEVCHSQQIQNRQDKQLIVAGVSDASTPDSDKLNIACSFPGSGFSIVDICPARICVRTTGFP